MQVTGNQQSSSPIKTVTIHFVLGCIVLGAVFHVSPAAAAQTRTLRVVTYNIEDDINGATVPLPGLIAPPANTNDVQAGGVLEGIGEEILGSDPAQPLDVLALQETTGNTNKKQSNKNSRNPFCSGLHRPWRGPRHFTGRCGPNPDPARRHLQH